MSNYQIYLWKPWVNHSANLAEGLTITVPASTGVLIVSALAVLVSLAGGAAWMITSYALHQVRTQNSPQDGMFRMLQVMLRNPESSASSVISIVQTGHVWSGKVSSAKIRAYGLALWPFVISVSFIIASVFVGRVTVAAYKANVVLLTPTNCGLEVVQSASDLVTRGTVNYQWSAKHSNDTRQSRAYGDQCYGSPNGTLGCSIFAVQRLPFDIRSNAVCPFDDLCRLGRESAVELDTGLLDSHTHLGINARSKDRVGFRRTATCSVLPRLGPFTNVTEDPHTNGSTWRFEVDLGSIGPRQNPLLNFTLLYNEITSIQSISYKVTTIMSYAGRTPSPFNFDPIRQLNLTDADLSLLFLMPNGVMYQDATFDPLFSANGTYTWTESDGVGNNVTWYLPDHFVTAYACSEQIQFCDPTTGTCTPAQGWIQQSLNDYEPLNLNNNQRATAQRILYAHQSSLMHNAAGAGAEALSTSDVLVDGLYSPALPDNQWILETTRWFQTSLANVQHRIVDYPNNNWAANQSDQWDAAGPAFGVVSPANWNDPAAPALETQCRSQLVRSTDEYQSFVLVGVIVVVLISCTLIIMSWTLHCCVSKRKDRRSGGGNRHKLIAYIADSKTHLLYTSLRSAGYTGWQDEVESMPTRDAAHYSGGAKDIEAVMESDGLIWQLGSRHGIIEYDQVLLETEARDGK